MGTGNTKKQPPQVPYNLADYNRAYATFTWAETEKELGWQPGEPVNIADACVDRHVREGRGGRTAIICDDGERTKLFTYNELAELTNRFANGLKKLGVDQGERVVLFLPAGAEFHISLLGVVKAGAIAVPLHSKFMDDAVQGLLRDSEPAVVITTAALRGRIKEGAVPSLRRVIVVGGKERQDQWRSIIDDASAEPATRWMDREDPMLLLYTSGSTGTPKGVVHVHEGTLQYYQTGRWVLDLKDGDVYWCTADPGWVTGISYGIWAPLLNGVATLIYTGPFSAENWYGVLERNRVAIWYTTPTSLRMLMAGDSAAARKYKYNHLRFIFSVGEPLNPIVSRWSQNTLNHPVHDSWWMTETGAQMIANFPCLPLKPGSMGKPIPGIYAAVVGERGEELPPLEMGQLAVKAGWPAMMRDIWKDREKYDSYFRLPPWYLTGDLAYRDREGYFWFQGRADDMIKTGGERVGPFEIESKLVEHPAVAEAGVIGKPDSMRGESIKAFIVLNPRYTWSEKLNAEIRHFIKTRLASHLVPDEIEVCSALPRTRSGKLMRGVLKSRELGLPVSDPEQWE